MKIPRALVYPCAVKTWPSQTATVALSMGLCVSKSVTDPVRVISSSGAADEGANSRITINSMIKKQGETHAHCQSAQHVLLMLSMDPFIFNYNPRGCVKYLVKNGFYPYFMI